MPDTIRKVDSVRRWPATRPGRRPRYLSTLVSPGVNLLACTGFPRGHRAPSDVVRDDARKFNAAARKADLHSYPKDRLPHLGDDRPGALADNMKKLAEAKVNVTAVDGLSAGKGRWGAILWVKPKDLRKAGRVLRARRADHRSRLVDPRILSHGSSSTSSAPPLTRGRSAAPP